MTTDSDDVRREDDETWRGLLNGDDRSLVRLRSFWGRIPQGPRCKVCAAPFGGPGAALTRVAMRGRATTNPFMCNSCFRQLRKHPGGAEIPLSVLFADVRGSTALAERTTPAEFRRLLHRFYEVATRAIEAADGVVDKFLGDGVMALFIPVIAGPDHPTHAVTAGREVLLGVARDEQLAGGLAVGAGVHTGLAFAGAIGSADRLDFSALGDTVNVAARLGSLAGPGELLVSVDAWRASGGGADVAIRTVDIAGRSQGLEVAALSVPESAAPLAG